MDRLKYNRKKQGGLYIIEQGICELENPFGFNNVFLSTGDFFGENLLFETKSFSFFGRIRVESERAKCLFINKDQFHQIPCLDVRLMQENCRNRKDIQNLEFI